LQLTGHASDALDHVYLGLDDDIEYDPLSSIGLDVLDTVPGKVIH
jgi:hypothetical protein